MKEGKEILEKDPILRRIVEIIVKEIDPDKIILFGSRARGDYKEDSDYDILVIKEGVRSEERRNLATTLEMAFLEAKIFRYASVDIVVQSAARFEELINVPYTIYYYAHREGITVYEKPSKKVA